MEVRTRQKPFKASCLMKAGVSAAYTAGQLMNLAPICLGSVLTGSTTVTPVTMTGIRNGMTVVGVLGLTAGYTVSNVGSATFTVSAAATATSAATTLTFTATDLPKFDLSAFVVPGGTVEINSIEAHSSAGASSVKLAPTVFLYSTSAVQTTVSNGTALTPSFDTQSTYCEARVVLTSASASFSNVGASATTTYANELTRRANVDANSCLHMAAMDANTYLYSSTETIKFVMKGLVL